MYIKIEIEKILNSLTYQNGSKKFKIIKKLIYIVILLTMIRFKIKGKQAQMCYKLRPCAFLYFIISQWTGKFY